MKISDIPALIEAECIQNKFTDGEIKAVYCSDLLSDVLGKAPENSILITVQAHQNTVAVASMKDSPVIIVCNNRTCPPDMLQAAALQNIGIFITHLDQFVVSGRIYTTLGLSKDADN